VATQRRVKVAALGSVTLFDHLFWLPTLTPDFGTAFVAPLEGRAGTVHFGGQGLNQAVVMGRLGVRTYALGVVGDDLESSGYAAHLTARGVDPSTLVRVPEPSGHSFIMHAEDGGTLLVVEEGAATRTPPPQTATLPPDVGYVVVNMPFDSYAVAVARQAAARGSQVVVAGQLGTASEVDRRQLAALTDWICCNRSEADSLGLDDPARLASEFPRLRGKWITAGAAGIDFTDAAGSTFHVDPAPASEVVDPTGAGDAVVGGLVAGLALGLDLEDATRLGAVVASFVIAAVGAQSNSPTLAQAVKRFSATWPLPAALEEVPA